MNYTFKFVNALTYQLFPFSDQKAIVVSGATEKILSQNMFNIGIEIPTK